MIDGTIKRNVDNGNAEMARSLLGKMAYMVVNNESFDDFKQSVEYAKDNLTDLFEVDDKTIKVSNQLEDIADSLMKNFSQEKLESFYLAANERFHINDDEREEDSDFFSVKKRRKKILFLTVIGLILIGAIITIVNLVKR